MKNEKMDKEYKKTKIGKIPKEWKVVRVSDILSLEYGKGLPERDRIPGKYPVVGSNGVVGYHNRALVKGPGIVVGRKGTIGAVNWIDFDFWPIDTTYYVKIKREDVFLKWLFYELIYLNPSRFNLSDVVPGLKRELVYSMKAPLPPIEEQRKIAEILSTVDNAIQKVDEAIAKTKRLKKGLMQELLTKGIGHKEFKDTEIGRIPKEWKVVRVGNIASFKNGLNFSQESRGRGILFVNVPDVFSEGIYINPSEVERADFGDSNKTSQYYLNPGDLLFVRSSVKREGVGWVSMFNGYEEPVVFCGFLIRARIEQNDISSEFLTYLLRYDKYRKLLVSGSGTVAITNITQESLKSLKIPLPPLPEQQKIAEILSTIDRKLELERRRKEKLERIKRGLMNDLLTGRRRVRV